MKRWIVILFCCLGGLAPLNAQDSPPPTPDPAEAALALNVWVTTQDFSALRQGPGVAFSRLTVVPAATTLPAIGRSTDGRWVQVDYDGQRGWIATWLLVWSGNMSNLPIDGVNPVPFARKIGVVAITTRETPVYVNAVAPENQVGVIPAGVEVEVTARLGASDFMQFQITYNGQVYWVGSWNLRIRDSDWITLLDTSYLYPFGRLVGLLDREINSALQTFYAIESLWVTLNNGNPVSCNEIPRQVSLQQISDGDVRREPVFGPVVDAVETAFTSVNNAITLLEDACGRPPEEFFITRDEINTALDDLDTAVRNFNLARSLLGSLRTRDPLVNPDAPDLDF
ncbi:MAG: SH3 domain-containing protein [Anaerolineae bacterium]|jgi:uncharacterized protein YraI|nr:SH3 domain-containing protein [Anaerolineae bacterium]